MVLKIRENVHIITRRLFEGDICRHFVGAVVAASERMARVQGYTFVYDPDRKEFIKKEDRREIVIGTGDSGYLIHVLPTSVIIDEVTFAASDGRKLVLTDSKEFRMDISEFFFQA